MEGGEGGRDFGVVLQVGVPAGTEGVAEALAQ